MLSFNWLCSFVPIPAPPIAVLKARKLSSTAGEFAMILAVLGIMPKACCTMSNSYFVQPVAT